MPRIIKARTNQELIDLSHLEGDHYVGGTQGLFLRVRRTTNGLFTKTWYLTDQRNGQRKTYSLQRHYPECSLKQARELAFKKRQALSGANPFLSEDAVLNTNVSTFTPSFQLRSAIPERVTVERAIDEYLKVKEKTWKNGATERVRTESVWRKHLASILKRYVYEIEIRDMEDCLRACHEHSYSTYAKHLPRLAQFFQWATYKGYRTRDQQNPCDKETLSVLLPKPLNDYKSHARPSLPIELIPEFFADLINDSSIPAYCLMLLILTGVRPGNSASAKWTEFNNDFTLWTVSATNMKVAANGQHKVPLSSQATLLLRFLKYRAISPVYVFPSPQFEKGAITTTSMTALVRRMHLRRIKDGKTGWIDPELSEQWDSERIAVPHGTARAGISTWNFEYNISDKRTIDLILHHSVSDYQGAYDRAKNMDAKKTYVTTLGRLLFQQNQFRLLFHIRT